MKISVDDIPGLDDKARALVAGSAMNIAVPAGAKVFEPGKQCEMFYLLSRGRIRVQIVAESGREIVLYRVGPGDACIMTVSCLMGKGTYNGEGIVEEEVAGFAIGRAIFKDLLRISDRFRDDIFSAYSGRFLDLVDVLENVAFRPLEARLAALLLRLDMGDGSVAATHQYLATDLGSSREVISRLLKRWEERAYIQLERGVIRLNESNALRALTNRD